MQLADSSQRCTQRRPETDPLEIHDRRPQFEILTASSPLRRSLLRLDQAAGVSARPVDSGNTEKHCKI
jgi:hypothetical protein